MSDIITYNGGLRVNRTKKAFDIMELKELMRAWELSFTLLNNDPARACITTSSIYEVDGQKFDINSFDQNSGSNNKTVVKCYHVSYRLNNYKIAIGYSFVGTVAELVADLLSILS